MIIVRHVYSFVVFLISLMKTGIGQSRYCIPQPFSRCLISLLHCFFFHFNSIFIFFDWSRSCSIQRWATLIVHGFCSAFSSLSLHYCTGLLKFTFDWYETVFCRSALWGCFGNFKIKRKTWLRFQNSPMNQFDTTTTQFPAQPQIHHNLVSRSLAEEAWMVDKSSGYEINYIKPKCSLRANVSQLFCSHFRVRQEKRRRISRKTQKVLWNIQTCAVLLWRFNQNETCQTCSHLLQ